MVEHIRQEVGDTLDAIVLTGSLARGEGVTATHQGSELLLSDFDVYAVARQPQAVNVTRLRSTLLDNLDWSRFPASLDLGVVDRDYFRRVAATLPGQQCRSGARVLWSHEDDWNPGIPECAIDPDDARKLLHNRFAENLMTRARPEVRVSLNGTKMWLDAPLAFLAAFGQYSAGRESQLETLGALVGRDARLASWASDGLEKCRNLIADLKQVLPLDRLQELSVDEKMSVEEWCWPFHRALLDPGAGPVEALRRGVLGAHPCDSDVERGLKWLRRRGVLGSLRHARRWAPLSTVPTSPWWKHGPGGIGPDRIHLAAALRFAGLDEWNVPLRDLVDSDIPDDEADEWIGLLWNGWIMQGARG